MKNNQINKEQRLKIIGYIRNYLMSFGNPRLQMLIILSILFILGFLFSTSLFHLGLEKMWIRYSITSFFSYLIFFVLIRIWSYFAIKNLDIPPQQVHEYFSFDQELEISEKIARLSFKKNSIISFDDSHNSSSDSAIFDWVFEHEYFLLVVLLAIITISIIFLFGYALFIAPTFFSEILFELLIISFVYKKSKNIKPSDGMKLFLSGLLYHFH